MAATAAVVVVVAPLACEVVLPASMSCPIACCCCLLLGVEKKTTLSTLLIPTTAAATIAITTNAATSTNMTAAGVAAPLPTELVGSQLQASGDGAVAVAANVDGAVAAALVASGGDVTFCDCVGSVNEDVSTSSRGVSMEVATSRRIAAVSTSDGTAPATAGERCCIAARALRNYRSENTNLMVRCCCVDSN